MSKPNVGDIVRCLPNDFGTELVHICTVDALLDTQFTATYEVARIGKHSTHTGWIERTLFRFYKDEGTTWEKQS